MVEFIEADTGRADKREFHFRSRSLPGRRYRVVAWGEPNGAVWLDHRGGGHFDECPARAQCWHLRVVRTTIEDDGWEQGWRDRAGAEAWAL